MPVVSFGGLASGLDTSSIISQLVNLERTKINRMQADKSELTANASGYTALSSRLESLQGVLESMKDPEEFAQLSLSSSNEDVLTVAATGNATPGSYDVEVSQLARAHKVMSDEVAAPDQTGLFGDGTLSITVGSNPAVDVTVAPGSTLADVKTQINDADAGVYASIINTGSGYRLMVQSKETGADQTVTFTEGGTLALGLDNPANVLNSAQDASVVIDGTLTVTSADNTLDGVIEGISMDLTKEDPGNPLRITIARDTEKQVEKFDELVDAYNSVISYIDSRIKPAEPGTTGGLINDSTMRSVRSNIAEKFRTVVSGLAYDSTSLIGFETQRDGTITLDKETLTDALTSDFNGVLELFAQDTTGLADVVDETIDALIGTDGVIPNRKDSIDRQQRSIDDRILRENLRIDAYEQRLVRQFTAMERAVSNLNSQASFLQSSLLGLQTNQQ